MKQKKLQMKIPEEAPQQKTNQRFNQPLNLDSSKADSMKIIRNFQTDQSPSNLQNETNSRFNLNSDNLDSSKANTMDQIHNFQEPEIKPKGSSRFTVSQADDEDEDDE